MISIHFSAKSHTLAQVPWVRTASSWTLLRSCRRAHTACTQAFFTKVTGMQQQPPSEACQLLQPLLQRRSGRWSHIMKINSSFRAHTATLPEQHLASCGLSASHRRRPVPVGNRAAQSPIGKLGVRYHASKMHFLQATAVSCAKESHFFHLKTSLVLERSNTLFVRRLFACLRSIPDLFLIIHNYQLMKATRLLSDQSSAQEQVRHG